MLKILILCNKEDYLCRLLHRRLLAVGAAADLVTADQLVFACEWNHTLDRKGGSQTEISLQDGRHVSSNRLKRVFNRIRFFPAGYLFDSGDRSYAEMELYALYMSFLESVSCLLAEPLETRFMSLEQDNTLFFHHMAVESNLPVVDYHLTTTPRIYHTPGFVPVLPQSWASPSAAHKSPYLVWQNRPVLFLQPFTSSTTVHVVGQKILGDQRLPFEGAIREFAGRIGKRFFDIHFVETEEGYKVHSVDPFPAFASPHTIRALAELLIESSEEER